jgi:outer membrane protein assembly factor BamB
MLTRQGFVALVLILGVAVSPGLAEDWPQWLGPQRDSVWRETGIVKELPKGGPTVKWRIQVHCGYAGPAVAGGRVYHFDYDTADDWRKEGFRSKLTGKERVLCVDATTGKEVWKYDYECNYNISYPAGPRCTPTVSGGKVYALGAMGDLTCLDAKSGQKVWSKNLPKEYKAEVPFWGYSGHPLVDGNRLYVLAGGKGTIAVALDKDNGQELWHALSDAEIGYSPPTLIKAGGVDQLLVWHTKAINALDPKTGQVHWSLPLDTFSGMSIMPPRQLGDLLFVGGIDKKCLVAKLDATKPAAEVLWRGKAKTGVYPVNSAPFLEDGYIYGVDLDSKLYCVKLDDGERLWGTLAPTVGTEDVKTGTAFIVKNGDRFFLFNERGELIIAKMSPKGYEEMSRARILDPTGLAFKRDVVWSHPAFADRCMFARNDKELVCVSLAQ